MEAKGLFKETFPYLIFVDIPRKTRNTSLCSPFDFIISIGLDLLLLHSFYKQSIVLHGATKYHALFIKLYAYMNENPFK